MKEKLSSVINTLCSWLLVFAVLGLVVWGYDQPGGPEFIKQAAGYAFALFIVIVILILL